MQRWLVTIAWILASLACQTETTPPQVVGVLQAPQTDMADAGDRAFVRRAVLLVWGRHPRGVAEIDALESLLETTSRAELVRAMSAAPEFVERWEPFVRDAIAAERIGARSNELCYLARRLGDPGPALATHVRDSAPTDSPYSAEFTMGDLIRSALRLGDLSVVFRVHQFANLMNDYDLPDEAGAIAARQSRAEVFMRSHWNRRTQCLDCHNSEWSTTQSEDPNLNRAWPVRGLFEKAVFSESRGLPLHRVRGFFRRRGVVAGVRYENEPPAPEDETDAGVSPWGLAEVCGVFFPPNEVLSDDLGDDSLLAGRGGNRASVWDLEAILRDGFDALRDGLDLDANGEVQPAEAAAWLIAMHFTDRVVEEALGARLTIDNDFPRTEAQRDLLASLTSAFVTGGFSLAELLVSIAGSDVFNRPLPAAGMESAEPFARILDPWIDDERPRDERTNGMGHRVHRLSGRTLLRAVVHALDVTPLREFPLFIQAPEAEMHTSLGVYLKEGSPAFSDSSFQSLLALEHAYGACGDIPALDDCTFETYLRSGGGTEEVRCEICAGHLAACEWDGRCCDVPWDAYCDATCLANPIDPGYDEVIPYDPVVETPWIDRLLQTAGQTPNTTLHQVVRAIKDRLLAVSDLDAEETAVLSELLGTPLNTLYEPAHDAALRRACGAMLSSPYFVLGGHQGPGGASDQEPADLAVPGESPEEICMRLGQVMYGDNGWTCDNGRLQRSANP